MGDHSSVGCMEFCVKKRLRMNDYRSHLGFIILVDLGKEDKQMEKFTILSFACIYAVACSPTRDLLVDDSFSSKEQALINDAIGEWAEAISSPSADIKIIGTTDHTFIIDDFYTWKDVGGIYKIHITDSSYIELNEDLDFCHFGGYSNDLYGIIVIAVEHVPSSRFKRVILHELGHLYGLEHSDSGIMKPRGEVDCVDEHAIAQFCDENDCTAEAHSTCNN